MRSFLLLPLAALTLSACGGTQNRGVESVHQPVVSRSDYVLDLSNGSGADANRQLNAWFESIDLRYGDKVSIDDPTSSTANRSAIAAVANRYGIELEDTAPVTQGTIPPGSFRVVVSRTTATVPGCPDWSRTSTGNFNNDMASNYGCATNSNLAAMVANPEDLVSGREQPLGHNKIGSARSRANGGK